MPRERKAQKILPITGICFIIFIVLLFLLNSLPAGFSTARGGSETLLSDWQFYWSEKPPEQNPENVVWKYADLSRTIPRSRGGQYIHLRTTLPSFEQHQLLHLETHHNPVTVLINGVKYAENGSSSQIWTGNKQLNLFVDAEYSQATVDIIMRVPIAFGFSASLFQWDSRQNAGLVLHWQVFSSTFLFLAGLFVLLLSAFLSIKNQKLGKLALCGLLLLNTGFLHLLPYMDTFGLNASNSWFFQLQLASVMLMPALLLSLMASVLQPRSLRILALLLFAYPAVFAFIRNAGVLYYMLMAYPILLLLTLLPFTALAVRAVARAVEYSGGIYAGFLLFSMGILYDLASYLYAHRVGIILLKMPCGAFLFIMLLVASCKQLIHINIRMEEQTKQIRRDAIWIERVINACASIFVQQTLEDFCAQTAKSIHQLILLDAADQGVPKEEIGHITICAGLKSEGVYRMILSQGKSVPCDCALIESRLLKSGEQVVFGSSFLDILLFIRELPAVALHFEGITHGLSDNLKNIIQIAYSNISVALDNLILKWDMNQTQEQIYLSLSEIAESKSEETSAHCRRVSEYVRVICEEMNMNPHEAATVAKASMMHDIGKLAIPEGILSKHSALSDREFEIVKDHVLFGYHILSKAPGDFMQAAAVIAQQHHEQWNGEGYLGLFGEQIHPYARIVSLVDVFDALLSERSYKAPWSFEQTCGYILEQSGIRFDPAVVQAFHRGLNRLRQIREMYPD